MDIEFQEFRKIPRLSREIIISEKIDGTNAQVIIEEFDESKHLHPLSVELYVDPVPICNDGLTPEFIPTHCMAIYAGSKTRIIYPNDDNYGFARWVQEHAHELAQLGPGRHFGEWWGQGIKRKYGLKEKRFSLFNVSRWSDDSFRPSCCDVVPVIYKGMFELEVVRDALNFLDMNGSMAAPGYMNPEGIVIFHTALNGYFKKTIKDDSVPKSTGE